MGLLSQCVLPKAPNDFEAWQELLPRLAGFFTSGPGVGLEQLALLGKWGQNDWLDLTTRTGAFNALQGLTQLWADWYVTHDAITLSLAFACWSSIACWLMQEITGNLSLCTLALSVLSKLTTSACAQAKWIVSGPSYPSYIRRISPFTGISSNTASLILSIT